MRIDRKAITEEVQAEIYLLKPQNERFLKWEQLIFGGNGDTFEDDIPVRLPLTILFLVLLLLSFPNFAYQAWRYYMFSTQGVNAIEELVGKDEATLDRNNDYYLTYRYSYGTEQFTRTVELPYNRFSNAEIGSQREVILVPSNREMMTYNLNAVFNFFVFFLVVVMLILLVYLYCVYRWYRKVWLIPAKITEVELGEKHTNRGVHQTFEISYQFPSPKTKILLKGRQSIPIRQDSPTTEQLLAVLYRNDTDFLPL